MNSLASKITDAEWQVMKAVWQQSPLTAAAIVEYLKPETDWSPKTIQTLIGRLVKKGVLGIDKETNPFQYHPLLSETECMHGQTTSFLQKVYGGSIHLLIANFVNEENLSIQEISELRSLLDEKVNR
jgi:BlaI family transcriptional regulator, penicillinase repressor